MTGAPGTAAGAAFRQFVLKMHSRCDLACDHCYVYQHADQSWAGRPRVISERIVDATAARIAEHVAAHPEIPRVHVILHGGEPLLAGRTRLARTAGVLRGALDGLCELDLRMQTNGLRLDEDMCAMLAAEGISTGISLDGDRAANDRHRVRADGSGSYDAVVRAVRLLGSPRHRRAFAGLLCTIDVDNDPIAVYEALAALEPPRVDFLLPHATWDHPPARDPTHPAAYARWLIAVYERWSADQRPFPVRLFDSLEAGRDGRESFTESLGLGSPDLVVVETDGEIEQADWLKTVAPGAPGTGFHVLRNSFDEAAAHPGFLVRRQGLDALSATCRECSVVRICGGGLYGHRHRAGSGFDNPSVYCDDLFRLIGHVLQAPRPRPPARPHVLTAGGFDAIAAGGGDSEALQALAAAELSARRALVGAVCGRHPGPGADLLTRLDLAHPRAAADVLRQPYLGLWAVRALEGELEVPAVRGRLAEIATAVAYAAGEELRVELVPQDGALHIPGAGRLTVPDDLGRVVLAVRRRELLLQAGLHLPPQPVTGELRPGFGWEPVRRIDAGAFRFLVEDGDPFRDGYGSAAAPRLGEAEFARWQRAFGEASRHIRLRYGRLAPGIRTVVTACTPLAGEGPQGAVAVNPAAFGALGLALPDSAADLAGLTAEGVQQVKFNALLDLFDLAGSQAAAERLRSVYLGRSAASAIRDDGLTALGRRVAAGLRG
ncbi:FxsB family cyclophane-forming radical SAM/SPASM peptide maturase [Actinacidiphila bryophytorum]|uniref:FxsB family cyclophane-forming radical SAM/SPASM peptide maturase n=1 Tax=Actinacidiphila bryophytorum TaxID=1436133 RepID=UPI002176A73C|nr:FxsB family cyclophane-forming radical SAM/SPASM peptide maturase [Actinacidiphila bryophytorum]UWE12462.1 FxsB family radical SAM/SPASM domain protein [Actinacidiphila bryophytorum]